jgi:hypothetical protein
MGKTLALIALAALFALPAHAWTTVEPSRPFAGYGEPQIQTRPNIFGGGGARLGKGSGATGGPGCYAPPGSGPFWC